MGYRTTPEVRLGMLQAANLIHQALDLLDACSAPPILTAHLERALIELTASLDEKP